MPGYGRLNEAAASSSKRRQFNVLLTVTAPHERTVFAIAVLLILALFAWGLFGRVEHGIMLDGLLIKPGDRYEVVSTESGHLIEFLVFPGDYVNKDDQIARQSVPELDREVAALRRSLDLLERGAAQVDKNNTSMPLHLEVVSTALLEMEARRSVRERIVAHVEGEVMALNSAPGDFIHAGASIARIRGNSDEETGAIQAVLRVVPDVAQRIRPGMQAEVDVELLGNDSQQLNGEVVSVTPGPLPKWLASMKPMTEDILHRIDIVLHQEPDSSVANGSPCRVRIVLGKASPVALLAPNLF